jgi:helix-turn-helix protein
MQHHLRTDLFKGGVHDLCEAAETFSQRKERDLGSMEGWVVLACDWARLWQATSHHSQAVVATWRIAPAPRRRARLALTLAERDDISRGIASGSSIREIAGRLGRATSTVSREIMRHGGRPAYGAYDADCQAWVSALRSEEMSACREPQIAGYRCE